MSARNVRPYVHLSIFPLQILKTTSPPFSYLHISHTRHTHIYPNLGNNTGYKSLDPSHPCRRCWDKYAKPYAGALAYAPTNPSSATKNRTTTFQRPLPSFNTSRSPPSAPSLLTVQRSQTQIHQPRASSTPPPQIALASSWNRPPPGALVLPPGDPRIGGSLCWKCSGSGTVPFLIFEEVPCGVCSGVGRILH
jgi:hypothetical protein